MKTDKSESYQDSFFKPIQAHVWRVCDLALRARMRVGRGIVYKEEFSTALLELSSDRMLTDLVLQVTEPGWAPPVEGYKQYPWISDEVILRCVIRYFV